MPVKSIEFWILLLIPVTPGAFWYFVKLSKFLNMLQTKGVLIDHITINKNNATSYKLLIEYETKNDQKRIITSTFSYPLKPRTGTVYEIIYDPINSKKDRINSTRERYTVPIVACLIGILIDIIIIRLM
jgi:hypothetical protein